MADYMDPINYTPNAPVLLLHGTQDEHLPLRTFKRTKDTLTAAGSQPVYSFLISDLDHHWYIKTWHYCPQNYLNALGVSRAAETWNAFFKKGINDALSDFGDRTPGIMIRVSTEGIQKRYRTIVAVDDEANLDYDMLGAADGIRIGLSGTKFFHVYPGLDTLGLPDQGDIPTMTVMASCTANHKCFERSAYYGLSEEPEYFGSFAQIHYRQTYNGEELSWYLTSDVMSAGTSGDTVMTFEPDIRCYFYEIGNPDCECDDSVAPEGEEDVMSGALGL